MLRPGRSVPPALLTGAVWVDVPAGRRALGRRLRSRGGVGGRGGERRLDGVPHALEVALPVKGEAVLVLDGVGGLAAEP